MLAKPSPTTAYFGGNGEKDWGPNTKLLVDELNMTKVFNKFRMRNIILAEEVNSVNSVRLFSLSLSLSHIFPVDMFYSNRCITNYNGDIKTALYDYAYTDTIKNKVGKEVVYHCKEVCDAIDERQDYHEVTFKPQNEIDSKLKEAVLELVENIVGINTNS